MSFIFKLFLSTVIYIIGSAIHELREMATQGSQATTLGKVYSSLLQGMSTITDSEVT